MVPVPGKMGYGVPLFLVLVLAEGQSCWLWDHWRARSSVYNDMVKTCVSILFPLYLMLLLVARSRGEVLLPGNALIVLGGPGRDEPSDPS